MTAANETVRRPPHAVGHAVPRLLGTQRLARLAAAGDERAFAEIYRRYGGDLHRYCRAMLGNAAEADDALQNTMVSAMRALPGEGREIALKPWLFRVAHNEAVSLLRARRPAAELDPDRPAAPAADASHAANERLRQLVRDLQRLPERQRGALVMRELSGLSFEELGATLGCSPATARQTLYEARLALQEIAAGREMQCEAARQAISERDGRVLRGRKLRAHLSECERCRDFRAAIFERRGDLGTARAPAGAPGGTRAAQRTRRRRGHGKRTRARRLRGGQVGGPLALAAVTIGAGAAQVGGVVDLPGFGQGGVRRASGWKRTRVRTSSERHHRTEADRAAELGGAGEHRSVGTPATREAQRPAHPGPPGHANGQRRHGRTRPLPARSRRRQARR